MRPSASEADPAESRSPRLRRFAAVSFVCLAAPVLIQAWYITFGGNFYAVVPGSVYRSAQPSTEELRRLVAAHGLRTVINLRGDNTEAWYYEEHAVGRELGVKIVDVGLWAKSAPPTDQFRLLVEILADDPGPILVHCNGGGDRSGLAAALALLLRTDTTPARARQQLSLFYGHNPFSAATCMERVLDRYEQWLAEHGWEHQPVRLRQWALTVYTAE
jgi:protein tyrosine phosphatase (PTP) superfamily phosphohydrolase (DUF442 family)